MSEDTKPNKPTVSVTLALIAPVIALLGTFFTIWNQNQLEDKRLQNQQKMEHERWRITREDNLTEELRREFFQFGMDALNYVQTAELIANAGYENPEEFQKDSDRYKTTAVPLLAGLPSRLAIIASHDSSLYERSKNILITCKNIHSDFSKAARKDAESGSVRLYLSSAMTSSRTSMSVILEYIADSYDMVNRMQSELPAKGND
jgi:hypothetical protein